MIKIIRENVPEHIDKLDTFATTGEINNGVDDSVLVSDKVWFGELKNSIESVDRAIVSDLKP